MEKLNRWLAKHNRAAVITTVIVGGVAVAAVPDVPLLDIPMELILYISTVILALWIASRPTYFTNKALKKLKDECDPYPLLQEMQTQLTCSYAKSIKQMILINQALALRVIGDYERAYSILESVNIERFSVNHAVKLIYYNNRMDICALMGKHQEAVIWYGKTTQILQDMRPSKQKERLRSVVETNRAVYHFCNGEYDLALCCLGQAKPETLCDRIENAMMYGRTYLAMGETQRAIKPLQFVAENGNKLYFATEARELLAKINMEEQ